MNRRTILILLASVTPAAAHSFKHGDIAIGHAWALPASLSDGQVFFPLVNNGKEAEALVAARSGICSAIELRRNARYDDPPEDKFELLPNQPLPMRPSARHLRLMGMKKPLVKGDIFPLILDFLNAGEIEVNIHVEEAPGE